MKYKCEDAKRDMQFVFSEKRIDNEGERKEAYARFYHHLLHKGGKKRKFCERCFKYFFKVKEEFSSRLSNLK